MVLMALPPPPPTPITFILAKVLLSGLTRAMICSYSFGEITPKLY
jgi:hypothetical protein